MLTKFQNYCVWIYSLGRYTYLWNGYYAEFVDYSRKTSFFLTNDVHRTKTCLRMTAHIWQSCHHQFLIYQDIWKNTLGSSAWAGFAKSSKDYSVFRVVRHRQLKPCPNMYICATACKNDHIIHRSSVVFLYLFRR